MTIADHLLALFALYLEPLWPYVWRLAAGCAIGVPVLVFVACCSVSGRCSREEEAVDNETCFRAEM